MLEKGSKLYSIFKNKCPRCHSGDFFVEAKLYKLKMHKNCPHCDLKYMLEPSFFYGAMYIAYALTVALAVAIFTTGYLLGFDLIVNFIGIILALVILSPLTMRLSRLIYINIFISFDSSKSIDS